MADLIHGKNVIISFETEEGGAEMVFEPIACSKSCTVTRTSEVIEITSYASNAKEFTEGMYEWGITLDGVITLEIFDYLLPPGKKYVQASFVDDAGISKTLRGDVIIPEISLTGDVADWSNFALTLKGTGAFIVF